MDLVRGFLLSANLDEQDDISRFDLAAFKRVLSWSPA